MTLTVIQAPIFTSAAATGFDVGVYGSFTVTASGYPAVTLSENGSDALPTGVTFNAATGSLSGTPVPGTAGTYTLDFTGSNSLGTVSQSFALTVNPDLAITTLTLPSWTNNQSYSQSITTSGGTGADTFAVTSGTLPAGLTLSSSGAITGTPSANGSSSFTITATDAVGGTASQSYSITINPALSITPATLPLGASGIDYIQNLAVSGGTTPYTTFSVTGFADNGTGLTSSEITTDASNGTININGTPTGIGSASFTVLVTDTSGATLSQSYTITIDDLLTY